MKLNSINILAASALIALCSCEKDNPFAYDKGNGQLNLDALKVEYSAATQNVRASEISESFLKPSIADFTVRISGAENKEYSYSAMPELVYLPQGSYTVEAYYGEDQDAAFNSPYFYGKGTNPFEIIADKITKYDETVVCRLSNVLVSIDFSKVGVACTDLNVAVKAGEAGTELNFTDKATDQVGCFRYVEGSNTLIATFSGKINGTEFSQVKTFEDVARGNHYKISFTIIVPIDSDTLVAGDITIDTRVESEDKNIEITPEENENNYTDIRPTEGTQNND